MCLRFSQLQLADKHRNLGNADTTNGQKEMLSATLSAVQTHAVRCKCCATLERVWHDADQLVTHCQVILAANGAQCLLWQLHAHDQSWHPLRCQLHHLHHGPQQCVHLTHPAVSTWITPTSE